MPQVVVGGNSGGCSTEALAATTGGSSALVHTDPNGGLFLIVALEGAASSAPGVIGFPVIVVGGIPIPVTLLSRAFHGSRAVELWWIPPPTPVGTPMVYQVLAEFSESAWYHTMLVSVSGMDRNDPVRGSGVSFGGTGYESEVQSAPHDAVLSYLNGEIDGNLSVPDHFCGSGRFFLHYDVTPGEPGVTVVKGNVSGFGREDWLHAAWALRP